MSYYIKAIKGRGEEVIKVLEDKGGKNNFDFTGDVDEYLYYIDKDNYIRESATLTSQLAVKNLCEELTLPEEEWKPKYKVGDTVKILSEVSSTNETIAIIRGINIDCRYYDVLTKEGMYHWAEEYLNLYEWIPKRGERVLIRCDKSLPWKEGIFSFYYEPTKGYYVEGGIAFTECVPFDINKLGKITNE